MLLVQDGKLLAERKVIERQVRTQPQNREYHDGGVSGIGLRKVNRFNPAGILANDPRRRNYPDNLSKARRAFMAPGHFRNASHLCNNRYNELLNFIVEHVPDG